MSASGRRVTVPEPTDRIDDLSLWREGPSSGGPGVEVTVGPPTTPVTKRPCTCSLDVAVDLTVSRSVFHGR